MKLIAGESMAASAAGCWLRMLLKADALTKNMMMAFRYISLFLCCWLMPAPAWADPPAPDFLSIQYLDKHKEKNGQVCQPFQLVGADEMVDTVAVYYQENRSPTLYQARVKDTRFAICVDRSSRIRVFAMARTPRKTFLAVTDTMLFGGSKTAPARLAAGQTATEFLSIHPHIDLRWPENFYWNQTGQNFRFKINTPFDAKLLHLSVLENGRMHHLRANRASEFTYVPPHHRNLRKAGPHAFRNDILLARLTDGASQFNVTYTLMLHRSRDAFDNHAAGTAVFTAGILFFTGLILMKRKTPWWQKSD